MSFLYRDRFKLRIIICLCLVTATIILCIGRIGAVCLDTRVAASVDNYVTVSIDSGRGDILDCNGKKITGATKIYSNIFLPTESGKAEFEKYANDNEYIVGERHFLNNKPAVLKRDFEINENGVYCIEVEERYGEINSLEHILGYINSENKGVTGIEKAYDDILIQSGESTVSFYVDASGDYLAGAEPIIKENAGDSAVYLTINKDIQKICSDAMTDIKKGAVVVTEIKSGKIRAMVSRPGYDATKVADYLERTDSPLLNRAINCYSTGSIFKPLIAAALLENGVGGFEYECTGICNISGIDFHCYNRTGHGKMDIANALCFSCNTYFYNAVGLVRPSALTSLATSLMLVSPINLAPGIVSKAGNIPDTPALKNPAVAANFSIGQGSVLLSPLAISNLYVAIANDGWYYTPTLIEGLKKNGKYKSEKPGDKNIVMSKGTSAALREYLSYVVSFGTGVNAMPEKGGALGKTATAQTGKYEAGIELVNAWFCGIFPKDNPEYVVTVFLEDSASGGGNSAPIFKKICDGINNLKIK